MTDFVDHQFETYKDHVESAVMNFEWEKLMHYDENMLTLVKRASALTLNAIQAWLQIAVPLIANILYYTVKGCQWILKHTWPVLEATVLRLDVKTRWMLLGCIIGLVVLLLCVRYVERVVGSWVRTKYNLTKTRYRKCMKYVADKSRLVALAIPHVLFLTCFAGLYWIGAMKWAVLNNGVVLFLLTWAYPIQSVCYHVIAQMFVPRKNWQEDLVVENAPMGSIEDSFLPYIRLHSMLSAKLYSSHEHVTTLYSALNAHASYWLLLALGFTFSKLPFCSYLVPSNSYLVLIELWLLLPQTNGAAVTTDLFLAVFGSMIPFLSNSKQLKHNLQAQLNPGDDSTASLAIHFVLKNFNQCLGLVCLVIPSFLAQYVLFFIATVAPSLAILRQLQNSSSGLQYLLQHPDKAPEPVPAPTNESVVTGLMSYLPSWLKRSSSTHIPDFEFPNVPGMIPMYAIFSSLAESTAILAICTFCMYLYYTIQYIPMTVFIVAIVILQNPYKNGTVVLFSILAVLTQPAFIYEHSLLLDCNINIENLAQELRTTNSTESKKAQKSLDSTRNLQAQVEMDKTDLLLKSARKDNNTQFYAPFLLLGSPALSTSKRGRMFRRAPPATSIENITSNSSSNSNNLPSLQPVLLNYTYETPAASTKHSARANRQPPTPQSEQKEEINPHI